MTISAHIPLLGIILIFFSVFLPLTAHGYLTTNQTALNLGDGKALYLIEFQFGHGSYEVSMPTKAVRSMSAIAPDTLSYSLVDDTGETITGGETMAMVISNAPHTEGMYRLPEGVGGTFTLLVFLDATEHTFQDSIRAQVTHLPFQFDRTQELALNPSELQYYATKSITLK